MIGTMEAKFSGCAVATHWLPHTVVQNFFCFLLVHKVKSPMTSTFGSMAEFVMRKTKEGIF